MMEGMIGVAAVEDEVGIDLGNSAKVVVFKKVGREVSLQFEKNEQSKIEVVEDVSTTDGETSTE